MSATIGINDLKFVIFGAGHDYTRLDSGDGAKMFFSHPKVPLNSVNYAGQYYFLVPDEDGNPIDAVMDDIAHCTFTPALGTAFDTEGEVEVKVKYRREYIHDEETILVEKELTQTIEVVDHGTVATALTSDYLRDIYTDGYIFWRPKNVNTITGYEYRGQYAQGNQYSSYAITKSSNIPWRAGNLGYKKYGSVYPFIATSTAIDLSELENADTSMVTEMYRLLSGSLVTDISPLNNWDTSNVTIMSELFKGTGIVNLEGVSNWNTSSVTTFEKPFANMYLLESTRGLENWDVSHATNLTEWFYYDYKLADFSGVSTWDVSHVTSLDSTFYRVGCTNANTFVTVDYSGLAGWDVSSVTSLYMTFSGASITSLHGVENWDVSHVTSLQGTFSGVANQTTDFSALAGWNVSSVTNMQGAFSSRKISSFSFLSGWSVGSVTNMQGMFSSVDGLSTTTAFENWNVGNVTNFSSMFFGLKSRNLDVQGLENWNVAKGTTFEKMFASDNNGGSPLYIQNITALANWTFTACTKANSMFNGAFNINTMTGLSAWRFQTSVVVSGIFSAWAEYYSSLLGKIVYGHPTNYVTYGYYDDEGNHYVRNQVQNMANPLDQHWKDADDALNWFASGSGKSAFSSDSWINIPSWN